MEENSYFGQIKFGMSDSQVDSGSMTFKYIISKEFVRKYSRYNEKDIQLKRRIMFHS